MRTLPNGVVSLALLFWCNSAWADTRSIVGTVIGTDGKPLIDAGVWAERVDAPRGSDKANPVVTKTIGKGQYTFSNLPVGIYQVLVTVKGVPKSGVKIKTRSDGWVRVDFDLRGTANVKATGKPNDATDSLRAHDLNRLQQGLGGNINNMSFPGH